MIRELYAQKKHNLIKEFEGEIRGFIFDKTQKKLFIFSLGWFLIGLIPAAIGRDVPHSNRALLALPGALLLATLGLSQLIDWLWQVRLQSLIGRYQVNTLLKAVLGVLFTLHLFIFFAYQNDYYTKFKTQSVTDFNDGYLEAFNYVIPYEKGLAGKQKADTIVFTNAYGQAYIYALFVSRTNPIWYQGGSLNHYLFMKVKPSDLERENALVVATPTEIPDLPADKYILGADGSVRFKIFLTGQK